MKITKWHLLIDREQSLQDLLTYYGINAKSNEVYDRVNTRLEEIRIFKKDKENYYDVITSRSNTASL